jgi:uncharacterized protein (TIGR04222 family)
MTWNPFNWTAAPFLSFYLCFAAIVFSLGYYLRSKIGPAAEATHRLSELELAYLGGGARRVGDVMLLGLTSGSGAVLDPKSHKISVTDQALLAALIDRPPLLTFKPAMTRREFQTAVEPIVEHLRAGLRKLGYCPTGRQVVSFWKSFLPFGVLLLAFGIIKAVVGAERGHPVGFLVILLILTVIGGIVLAVPPTRTRAGNDALQSYQASHQRASRAPLESELLLAVALSGAIVLSGTAFAPIYAASRSMIIGGDGSGGGGGCSGGGGGGGCGGCS